MEVQLKARYIEPFADDLPVVKTTTQEIVNIDEMLREKAIDNQIALSDFVLELDEEDDNIRNITILQFKFSSETQELNVKFGFKAKGDEDNMTCLRWTSDALTKELKGKVFVSKELINSMLEDDLNELLKNLLVDDALYPKALRMFEVVNNYIVSNDRVIYKTSNATVENNADVKKKQYTNKLHKKSENIQPISLGKATVINLSDVHRTVTYRKPCEYQFTRRGHWCHSKKTGKKWWVKEATINKDKPKKKTIYKLD